MALPTISRWEGRVALVTGGTAGIGAAICKSLVKHNLTVVACARHKDNIDDLIAECTKLGYKGKLDFVACDIKNEVEVEKMFAYIKTNYRGVDVVINDAGFNSGETIIESTAQQVREMLEVNVLGLVVVSSTAIKSMLERKVHDGHIFNINSILGHFVHNNPTDHAYSATKYAVTAITEGLRRELVIKGTQIRVTAISPAAVDTHGNATGPALTAQDVADTVIYALSAPAGVQIHDILLRATGTN